MSIVTAQATITSTSQLIAQTNFVFYRDGNIDVTDGSIRPQAIGRWAALSGTTWGEFSSYQQTVKQIRWTSDLVDIGVNDYFTLNIETEFDGALETFFVDVSSTGDFAGEEQHYVIEEGNINVPAFKGRYVYVTAIVDGSRLGRMTITASTASNEIRLTDIDTGSLPGTAGNRQINIPPVSLIKDIVIQPKVSTTYNVDLYVSSTPTSTLLIPMVVSKSGSDTRIGLFGIDNQPRDGVVDLAVNVMPRQAMFAGNLIVI